MTQRRSNRALVVLAAAILGVLIVAGIVAGEPVFVVLAVVVGVVGAAPRFRRR